jgi:hypothetical protein
MPTSFLEAQLRPSETPGSPFLSLFGEIANSINIFGRKESKSTIFSNTAATDQNPNSFNRPKNKEKPMRKTLEKCGDNTFA